MLRPGCRLWVSFALLDLLACKKEAARDARQEPSASASAEGAVAPLRLTDEMLGSYVRYQERMLEAYGARVDGGGKVEVQQVVDAEEQARRQSGLERRELAEIEQMMRAVIGKRVYGAAVPGDDSLDRMRALQSKLSEQGRAEVSKSIGEVEKSQEELVRLTEERRRFGDANVDLLLAHEAELTKLWKQMMASFAPREANARKRP